MENIEKKWWFVCKIKVLFLSDSYICSISVLFRQNQSFWQLQQKATWWNLDLLCFRNNYSNVVWDLWYTLLLLVWLWSEQDRFSLCHWTVNVTLSCSMMWKSFSLCLVYNHASPDLNFTSARDSSLMLAVCVVKCVWSFWTRWQRSATWHTEHL